MPNKTNAGDDLARLIRDQAYLDIVHKTKIPLVITQRGKSSAVLMDVTECEAIIEKIELLQDIQLAKSQIEDGKGTSNAKANSLQGATAFIAEVVFRIYQCFDNLKKSLATKAQIKEL